MQLSGVDVLQAELMAWVSDDKPAELFKGSGLACVLGVGPVGAIGPVGLDGPVLTAAKAVRRIPKAFGFHGLWWWLLVVVGVISS